MCGRFTLTLEASEIQLELGIEELPESWHSRYNIAPSQDVAIVRNTETGKLSWARWGLIPPWAKDSRIGQRLINARSETLQEKPSFRNAFLKRRCIVLADGFFEWKKGQKAQPYYFHLRDRKLFGFAGLWETWRAKPDSTPLETCTIITCEANELVSRVHARMPVILTKGNIWRWLSEESPAMLKELLIPCPSGEMDAFAVSTVVNSPVNDTINCIQPIDV